MAKLPGYLELLPPYKGTVSDDGRSVTFRVRINRRHPSYWLMAVRHYPAAALYLIRRWRNAARIAKRMTKP